MVQPAVPAGLPERKRKMNAAIEAVEAEIVSRNIDPDCVVAQLIRKGWKIVRHWNGSVMMSMLLPEQAALHREYNFTGKRVITVMAGAVIGMPTTIEERIPTEEGYDWIPFVE